jgi:hypothetical protein
LGKILQQQKLQLVWDNVEFGRLHCGIGNGRNRQKKKHESVKIFGETLKRTNYYFVRKTRDLKREKYQLRTAKTL